MPDAKTPRPSTESTQSQKSHNKAAGKEKTKEKTFMDRWVEPPIAPAAPSYQDHGGAPYGVLDGMQALGDLPSAKVKGRVKGDGARKSMLGRSSAVEAQETPLGSPAPQPPTPPPVDLPGPPPVMDDPEDDDYAPKANTKKRNLSTRSKGTVKRKSEPASSVTPAPAPAPTPAPPAAPPPVVAAPVPVKTKSAVGATERRAMEQSMQQQGHEYDGDKLKRVVEAAKERAIEVGKPDLAAAVNEIYEQSKTDHHLRALLSAILSQKATEDQNAEFQDYVRAAKKKLKDAKQAVRQQPAVLKPNGTQPRSTTKPLTTKLSLQSTPVLAAPGTATALPSTENREPPKGKISLKVKSPSKHGQHRKKTGKSLMSVSPRKRSGSMGSDSSLTDLTSNDEDDGMDLDEADEMHHGPPPPSAAIRMNGFKGKDQAAERGSLTIPLGGTKRSSADAELEQERDRVFADKKQKLGETVAREYDWQESDVRPAIPAPRSRAQQVRQEALPHPRSSPQANGSRGGSARPGRAVSMDIDSPLSSPAGSRQSTPKVWKPMPKPLGKRAKTKQSPEKKQTGPYGSMSGVVGGATRESPNGDDDNEERSENNDFCAACEGSGYLLCCDGCDRSFHFTCLDPPLNANAKELDEPWYCYICVSNRPPSLESPEKGQTVRGIFAPLLGGLKKRNPRNFELPQYYRDYYHGVATDKTGTFAEALNGKPLRNRPGYSEEQPDYSKLRDSKGNLVTCYSCHQTSQATALGEIKRPLVTCDHCGQHWHLDCLDPPLANPPALNKDGKKAHDWMCPLHADQELRRVPTSHLNRRTLHLRKPKAPKLVETALSRGHRNNGIIEVYDDESDSSESEFFEQDQEDGKVYKLPSSAIKLDFIDKVKSTRVQQLRDDRAYSRRANLLSLGRNVLDRAKFAKRPFVEQKVALNLAQFANENKDLNLSADRVQNLVDTMIAEAPTKVVEEYTAGEAAEKAKSVSSTIPPPSPPSSEQTDALSAEQREELQKLQELIRRRLEGSKT